MMKIVFRSIGIGCILSAAILYFTIPDNLTASTLNSEAELKKMRMELDRVKEELAVAQTLSSSKSQGQTTSKPVEKEKSEPVTEAVKEPLVKTVLSIESGSNSTIVSEKLERSGIISSSKELEQFLSDNHLAGRIQIGEYELDSTMSIKEIAGVITNTKK